ncbi:hypothetical protein GA0074692_6757 [Micromonospora pallida]|uniref:Winged helix DNA-binding domain-containing protein n=1 Tax=Micromonospora pallida TaxID=145854 RepID=A0A1C6TNP9_9ACTN|nr:hypothetical protein [Micromonospora pallida]SCL43193.1 hypothetical protein GA0074692_6757 [Micromonospora pallida]
MRTDLTVHDAVLLDAVERGRVHHDPLFDEDFEQIPDDVGARRAGHRMEPLKQANLVQLDDAADPNGMRLYRPTPHGREVLEEIRAVVASTTQRAVDTYRDYLASTGGGEHPGGDR